MPKHKIHSVLGGQHAPVYPERSNYSMNYSNNYRKYFEKEDRNGLYFELQPRVRIDFYDQTSSSQKSFDLNLNIKLGVHFKISLSCIFY